MSEYNECTDCGKPIDPLYNLCKDCHEKRADAFWNMRKKSSEEMSKDPTVKEEIEQIKQKRCTMREGK